jgi:FAD/FMN-containing dehydrogenase
MTSKEFELMKNIKKLFDPDGILNPGTKIPD